jgi:hypothetical protein
MQENKNRQQQQIKSSEDALLPLEGRQIRREQRRRRIQVPEHDASQGSRDSRPIHYYFMAVVMVPFVI